MNPAQREAVFLIVVVALALASALATSPCRGHLADYSGPGWEGFRAAEFGNSEPFTVRLPPGKYRLERVKESP